MELDTSDVGSEIPEPGELGELYESAEPRRKKNRGIDDSIVSNFPFPYFDHNLLIFSFSRLMRIVSSSMLIWAFPHGFPREIPKFLLAEDYLKDIELRAEYDRTKPILKSKCDVSETMTGNSWKVTLNLL